MFQVWVVPFWNLQRLFSVSFEEVDHRLTNQVGLWLCTVVHFFQIYNLHVFPKQNGGGSTRWTYFFAWSCGLCEFDPKHGDVHSVKGKKRELHRTSPCSPKLSSYTQTLNVWFIYLHLVDVYCTHSGCLGTGMCKLFGLMNSCDLTRGGMWV